LKCSSGLLNPSARKTAIFDAHLLVVEDRTLIDEVLRKLKTDLCNVEWMFQEVATRYAETLSKIDDPYLRERALDIQGVYEASNSQSAGQSSQDISFPEPAAHSGCA
jgi:phosphoenolpyruvate-protein kinase (PTS system EI component)